MTSTINSKIWIILTTCATLPKISIAHGRLKLPFYKVSNRNGKQHLFLHDFDYLSSCSRTPFKLWTNDKLRIPSSNGITKTFCYSRSFSFKLFQGFLQSYSHLFTWRGSKVAHIIIKSWVISFKEGHSDVQSLHFEVAAALSPNRCLI